MPYVCRLMAQPRGRSLTNLGHQMLSTFGNNMKNLFNVLTGNTASTTTIIGTTAMDTMESNSDARFFKQNHIPITYPDIEDCQFTPCTTTTTTTPNYNVVCESTRGVIFPLVGVSTITNTTVTIKQTFPNHLQPVFYNVCRNRAPHRIYDGQAQ
ncbi:hypothetical protein Pcinc_043600 [Petrolisthes cinctipes]|uniref:Uncharacterized protein n=1 Tax=Petrolisthes cinctipes TaxID=88211 RepID=A0AAE1BFC5_PETCI|nr:hypothetical protein Pcinc_043600 [Petrolisthes cinctipes]